jgi:UDP-N-acetylglucosamine:LPS N-acetylglucosamine transferase
MLNARIDAEQFEEISDPPARAYPRDPDRGTAPRRSGSGGTHKKILAVASGGGHWVQLLRVVPAFSARDEIVFVTTLASHRPQVTPSRCYVVTDGNRWNKFRLCRMAAKLLYILLRERPDVVISTGAAPGYFSLRFAKMLGARTIWVDSIANASQMSMSGLHVGRFADLWLTQWKHLARPNGPQFKGSVI